MMKTKMLFCLLCTGMMGMPRVAGAAGAARTELAAAAPDD